MQQLLLLQQAETEVGLPALRLSGDRVAQSIGRATPGEEVLGSILAVAAHSQLIR